MKKIASGTKYLIYAGVFAVLLSGCGRSEVKVKAQPVPVLTAVALSKDMPLEVSTFGNVEAYATIPIKTMVTGTIEKINFKPGQHVKKDDVLVKLDARPFEAALKQAEANLAKNKAMFEDYERQASMKKKLYTKEAIAEDDMKKIKAQADSYKASVDADIASIEKARLDLAYCVIKAPVDGITGDILINEGTTVKANDLNVLVLAQVRPVYVGFSVAQTSLPLIRQFYGKGNELEVDAVIPSNESHVEQGKLTFIDNSVSTSSGMIKLKAEYANADEYLWPGQYVQVVMRLTLEKNRVVVPGHAVQAGQEGTYVFLVKDTGKSKIVEYKLVTVDRNLGDETIIKSGLNAGEMVVTDGHVKLTPGAEVDIKDPDILKKLNPANRKKTTEEKKN